MSAWFSQSDTIPILLIDPLNGIGLHHCLERFSIALSAAARRLSCESVGVILICCFTEKLRSGIVLTGRLLRNKPARLRVFQISWFESYSNLHSIVYSSGILGGGFLSMGQGFPWLASWWMSYCDVDIASLGWSLIRITFAAGRLQGHAAYLLPCDKRTKRNAAMRELDAIPTRLYILFVLSRRLRQKKY